MHSLSGLCPDAFDLSPLDTGLIPIITQERAMQHHFRGTSLNAGTEVPQGSPAWLLCEDSVGERGWVWARRGPTGKMQPGGHSR